MIERQPGQSHRERPDYVAEIERPFSAGGRLFDFRDALLIDRKIIIAYKRLPLYRRGIKDVRDRIFVSRERTVPLIVERSGVEVYYPYRNEDELKGRFGTVYLDLEDGFVVYVGKDYKFTLTEMNREDRTIDFNLDSKRPMKFDFIDGDERYDAYLRGLSSE